MARLIPSFMDDRTPPGERDVFNVLAAGPDDWVALHSLDLAPWNRSLRTEIDFVIIVPDTGILCVEVKSHDSISFDGLRWYPETISRSPFKQACDGRHTFHRRLTELAPQFRRIPVAHCCIFPRATFDLPPNLSVQPWELMDMPAFRSFSCGEAFCADLKARLEQGIVTDERLVRLENSLSENQIDTLVKCCVPVQKHRPGSREEITRRESEIERILRDHQKPVLQLASLNTRLVVSGAAGTGKTLIAIEVARRAAERGHRVGLLCYNQLVGDWLREKVNESGAVLPHIVAGRAIRVMADMTGIVIPEEPSQAFWLVDLPDQLEEHLTDPDFKSSAVFDYLVLDEAQDILARPRLWQCVSQFLAGGIAQGAFALFGDFDHQVLTERATMQESLAQLNSSARPAIWSLSENCRNYRIVGETAVCLAGLSGPVYSGYLRSGGGVQSFDIFFYEDDTAQLAKLEQWMREFKADGYRSSEITLLSFRADDTSAAMRLKQAGRNLRPAWQSGILTAYASVHAFKGMENKVVILTDVVLNDIEVLRDLFYTGMTRATESVRVLCDMGSQKTLSRWLAGKADS